MDFGRFDALAKTIPHGARRQAVRVLSVVPVAGLLASVLSSREPARAGKKKRSQPGPQGPAGPQGPRGPQGPEGPKAITSRPQQRQKVCWLQQGSKVSCSVSCNPGEIPVSGGFDVYPVADVLVLRSEMRDDGWEIVMVNKNQEGHTDIYASVYCIPT